MEVKKHIVTVDLAKAHIKYGDYDIGVYKADVIKLCQVIDDLTKKE